MSVSQDLYGFRCECKESDRKNFYAVHEVQLKIKCLTCGATYVKRKGKYEQQKQNANNEQSTSD